ncbi:hypothetical protein AMELA_G00056040 [Ameiurus melas]|uniref:Uncharacterized protein n=1 Tax=Ameiurus melas TaxID=219545 RepID=A0A7J6B709_AMEME|nr:hypothetical protein AMELA_G00056040 [Ameiurus melas]
MICYNHTLDETAIFHTSAHTWDNLDHTHTLHPEFRFYFSHPVIVCVCERDVPGVLFQRPFGRDETVAHSHSVFLPPALILLVVFSVRLYSRLPADRSVCRRVIRVRDSVWCYVLLQVTIMSELATDSETAAAIFPVGHAHPLPADVRGLGVGRERDVFLERVEFLFCSFFKRVREHAAANRNAEPSQSRQGQLV